jgi:spermidine synthase
MPSYLVLALFFASGAAGLVYEVIWLRLLSLTLSVTVYATTTVLCAFMGGLALGAALAGRIADRLERPLLAYGLVELGVAATGLLIPTLLFNLAPAYVWSYQHFGGTGFLFNITRFLLAFVVLMLPCTLMGATLPFLSRTVGRADAVGRGLGALYAVNALGAVVGCVAAGFVLIPATGLWASSATAAAVNLIVGIVAIALAFRATHAPAPSHVPARSDSSRMRLYLVCLAFAVSGCTALGYEVLWTRALEHYTHNSTYAYTAMLATFLLGIGLGSAMASRVADRFSRPVLALGIVEIGIGVSVLCGLLIYARFDQLIPMAAVAVGGLNSWPRVTALIFGEAGATMLVTSLLFGATFPLVARAVVRDLDTVGERVAVAYTANTVGSIIGALAVGFILLPALGVGGSFIALIVLNLALGATLAFGAAPRRAGLVAVGAAAMLAGVAVLVISPRLFQETYARRFANLLYYREEVTDTVMVTEDSRGTRMIRFGDGRGTAGTITYPEDRMYAHVPLLLHPAPRRVLSICFGVGNSLSAVTMQPVEHVDAVELSPGVVDAAPFFRKTNRDVLADPRVRLTIGDGRNFLLASREKYDVIRLDPPELHTAGVVNLYTREFYELARAHLNPGGIFSIWVNNAMTPEADLRMLVRTVTNVFPHVSVWHGPLAYSWVINASVTPHAPDLGRLLGRFADPSVKADMASIGIPDPFVFLTHFVFADDQARAFGGEGPLVVDDHTRLDFTVPRSIESFFGITNFNTDHWLLNFLLEGGVLRPDSPFARKRERMEALKRSVLPHLVNVEAAGMDREEVLVRLARARRLPVSPPR